MSDRTGKNAEKTAAERALEARQKRQAEALRANLLRRKAQAKGRKALDMDNQGAERLPEAGDGAASAVGASTDSDAGGQAPAGYEGSK